MHVCVYVYVYIYIYIYVYPGLVWIRPKADLTHEGWNL